jgi:hypothetical protein
MGIIILIVILVIGPAFEKSDLQLSRDAEKLPPFTKKEAFDYYEKYIKK